MCNGVSDNEASQRDQNTFSHVTGDPTHRQMEGESVDDSVMSTEPSAELHVDSRAAAVSLRDKTNI